jgi:hypothetical protein
MADEDQTSIPPEAEIPSPSDSHEEPAAMLDVHPPHEAAHTWKDFFIHIATIVIGLLIAIGLEQTVEHFHNRNQVAEAREALRVERENDSKQLATQSVYFRRETAALQNNLTVLLYLQAHPGTPRDKLPGILTWHYAMTSFPDAAWVSAEQSGITALMPYAEVQGYASLYSRLRLINEMNDEYQKALFQAMMYHSQDPDPTHLSPAGLASEIELTKDALTKHLRHGVALSGLAEAYSDFAPGVSRADLEKIIHTSDDFDPALSAARALTVEKIDSVGKADDYFPQAGR